MTEIKCNVKEIKCSTEGCEQVFRTTQVLGPNATFICRIHTKSKHAGRPNNLSLRWPEGFRQPGRAASEKFVEDDYSENSNPE